ncbi:hypothetical protein [Rahnella laticis]|uniref:hypothetical protein n=1 Tax=Rahnella laticis TaxID=2787622 RepID=UPI0018A28034|nr:hypothetical protein [Rahnella laticis]MBF7995445.1 hypothetical protein [Rahnella laticis]
MQIEKRLHFYSPQSNHYQSRMSLFMIGRVMQSDAGIDCLSPCCLIREDVTGVMLFVSKLDAMIYAKNLSIEEKHQWEVYDFRDINPTEMIMNIHPLEGRFLAVIVFGFNADVYDRIRMPNGRLCVSHYQDIFTVNEKLSVLSPVQLLFSNENFDAMNEYWKDFYIDFCSEIEKQNKISYFDLEEHASMALKIIRKNKGCRDQYSVVTPETQYNVAHYSIPQSEWIISYLKYNDVN